MTIELRSKDALIMAALATKRPVAFLVGSPLSQQNGLGVPGVKEMLDFVRDEIRGRIAYALPTFEAQLPGTSDADDYQAAMRWLGGHAGQDAVNDVVARAVRRARRPGAGELRDDSDGEPDDWHIPAGTTALAELIARAEERFTGPILTTNFDPLLSLAVRKSGGRAVRRVFNADGTLAGAEDEPGICNIVYLHGFWRESDTLHTRAQLTNHRPKLKASLQRLLVVKRRTLIVAAYGGWDDVFTQALVELMNDEQAKLDVIWCFYEHDLAEIQKRYGTLLNAVEPAITANRFRLFGGIDCHTIFTEILSTLREMSAPAVVAAAVASPLAGWEQVDAAYLNALPALERDEVVKYFDGAVPTWRHAVSSAIPRRQAVADIAARLTTYQSGKGGCSMQLIRAAGGEGKSTVLLQAASDAASSGKWSVLWRPSPHGRLLAEHVVRLDASRQWLLVADDAETLVEDLKESARALHAEGRSHVHFLLAARDADWRSAFGDKPGWETWLDARVGRQQAIILRGIAPEDAHLVVEAWGKCGSDGLRELASLSGTADQVQSLISHVQAEAGQQFDPKKDSLADGSFFGGLLAVRFGQAGLQAHVRAFLDQLKGDRIHDSHRTLFDALLYVAACHAVDMPGIDKKVLADLLDVSREWVHTLVVNPLGEEAAAVHSAGHVLTRHKRVAAAILVSAEHDFGADVAEVWSAVVRQTVQTGRNSEVGLGYSEIVHAGPRLQRELPQQFSTQRRIEIAIAAARSAVVHQSTWLGCIVDLGKTYRIAGDSGRAVQTFRESLATASSKVDFSEVIRGYYYEWGMCEALRGNNDAWLQGLSLSDHLKTTIGEYQARVSCAGLGIAFGRLAKPGPDCRFARGRRAAAYLGRLATTHQRTLAYFRKHDNDADTIGTPHPKNVDEAVDWLREAVAQAGRELQDPFLAALLEPEQVSFDRLRQFVEPVRSPRQGASQQARRPAPRPASTSTTTPVTLSTEFADRIQAGIERVLTEAWRAVPTDLAEEDRFRLARRNAARAISGLSPHIKRPVTAHFETQKWRPLREHGQKP